MIEPANTLMYNSTGGEKMNKRLLYKYNLRKQFYVLKKLQKIRNNKNITNINDISKYSTNLFNEARK